LGARPTALRTWTATELLRLPIYSTASWLTLARPAHKSSKCHNKNTNHYF